MPPLALITETLDSDAASFLAGHAQVLWCPHDQPAELAKHLPHAQALVVRTYTRVDAALLAQAPLLRVVGRAGVGLDNVDVAACRARGVQVVYTPDANTQAVVEYVLALMLDALRPRAYLSGPVSEKEFHRLRKEQVGLQLNELTLGILGFGRIGKRLGQVAHALGMKLLVNDLLPAAQLAPLVHYPVEFVSKERLYRQSDILTIHVDGRPENHHLIGREALSMLKPDCLLINAARGMLVDNQALRQWAQEGAATRRRAILDVHDPEPMPADYPLHHLPNVLLLPHLASRTERALKNMSDVVQDVVRVLDGQTPRYPAP